MAESNWKRSLAFAAAAVSFGANQTSCHAADTNPINHSTEVGFQGANDSAQSGWLFVPYAQFKIPFNIEPGGASPAQVQLWVSTDNGMTWQLHSSLGTEKRFFEFRAAGEGAYLFAVQTRDTTGAAYPSPQPPMRVIVDTTRPEASIRADVDSSGRLIAQFEVNEQYLNVDSIRLEYRAENDTDWQPAVVDGINRTAQSMRGHAVISPAQSREVLLRLSISDLAQNKSEATVSFTMPRTASAATGMQLASKRAEQAQPRDNSQPRVATQRPSPASPFGVGPGREPIAPKSATPTPGGTLWNGDQPAASAMARTAGPAERSAGAKKPELASLKGWTDVENNSLGAAAAASQAPSSATASESAVRKPPSNSLVVGSSSANGLGLTASQPSTSAGNFPVSAVSEPEELPAPTAVGDTQTKSALENPLQLAPPVKPTATAHDKSSHPVPTKSPESAPSEIVDREVVDRGAPSSSPGSLLSQAYYSRSRAFSLDYAVDSLKGSQISDVELWGTEDSGRTWTQWGSDPDRESPFDVQVADDGLFGFRMVVVGGNGLVSHRPKEGDEADAWINVDSVAPSVKITRAVYGEGPEAGSLVIDYKCDDTNLHDRPVTLSFSDHLSGPWTTIASGLRNTGVYLWKASPELPKKIYLRIEATDRGGNVATHRLDLPIAVEGLAPRGRIQGFRPLLSTEY